MELGGDTAEQKMEPINKCLFSMGIACGVYLWGELMWNCAPISTTHHHQHHHQAKMMNYSLKGRDHSRSRLYVKVEIYGVGVPVMHVIAYSSSWKDQEVEPGQHEWGFLKPW